MHPIRHRGDGPGAWAVEWRNETGDFFVAAQVRDGPAQPHSAQMAGRPFVTTVVTHGGLRIAAVNARAQEAGIAPGMALADARALVRNVDVTTADGRADAKSLAALAAWCGQYTPWTAPETGSGPVGAGVWLDVTGCAHLFGGEQGLLEDLVGRVERLGYDARAGIADTPGAAWGVTRFGKGRTVLVAPGGAREALGDLPVGASRNRSTPRRPLSA